VLSSTTGLSALAPAQRLERSDFVRWHLSDMPSRSDDVRSWVQTGNDRLTVKTSLLTGADLDRSLKPARQYIRDVFLSAGRDGLAH
jgi:hypothetical protein